LNGRLLLDGGACNPLPFDHISECDLTVACDVAGGPTEMPEHRPGLLECVVGAAQISMQAVIREKLRWRQPDILVRPEINGVFILDFLKTQAILDMNVAFKDDLKRRLDLAVNTPLQSPSPLPALPEEPLKQSGGRAFPYSGINLWRMVTGGRAKEADAVIDRAPLGIAGPIVEAANAGKGNGRGAERARLEGDVEVAAG
jgi:hypothetical protein